MKAVLNHLAKVAKALVAAATPGVVIALDAVTVEASTQVTTLAAVIAAAVLTWLVPNRSS